MKQELPIKHGKVFPPFYRTLLYYVVVVILSVFFNVAPGFKSDMCNPGLDALFPFLALLISIVLLVVNGYGYFRQGKPYLPSVIIHASVISVVLLWLIVTMNQH